MQKMELNVHEEGAGLDKEMRSNGFLLDSLFRSHFDNKMRRGDAQGAVFAENSKRSEKGVGGLNDMGVGGADFSVGRSSSADMFTRSNSKSLVIDAPSLRKANINGPHTGNASFRKTEHNGQGMDLSQVSQVEPKGHSMNKFNLSKTNRNESSKAYRNEQIVERKTFSSANSQGGTDFSRANSNGQTNFSSNNRRANSNGQTDFSSANNQGSTDFSMANSSGQTNFSSNNSKANSNGQTNFSLANSQGRVTSNFNKANSNGEGTDKASFTNRINFSNSDNNIKSDRNGTGIVTANRNKTNHNGSGVPTANFSKTIGNGTTDDAHNKGNTFYTTPTWPL